MQAQIASIIRFFGKNIAQLQECNEAILKLARVFLVSVRNFLTPKFLLICCLFPPQRVTEMKLVKWPLRDSNAFLLMVTSLLLKRKDEVVIRQACSIMKEFTVLVKPEELKHLAKNHQKPIGFIFNKLSKVSTYMTQMKLLEILHVILKDLDDGGEKIIKQDRLVAICNKSMIDDTVSFFKDLDLDEYHHVSGKNSIEIA